MSEDTSRGASDDASRPPPVGPGTAAVTALPTAAPRAGRTVAWVGSTYFAEGLPYMLVRIVSGVYFTDIGVREKYLGYLNFLGVPWNLKFLWAPWLDQVGTKRAWMIGVQLAIGLLTGVVGVLAYLAGHAADASSYLLATSAVFVVLAALSATNDIAIDGYYLEALPERSDQAGYSGYRVLAYRGAVIYARSGLVALAAVAAANVFQGDRYSPWSIPFAAGAATMVVLAIGHAVLLPRVEVARARGEALKGYFQAFISYLDQPRIALILAFIVLYKMGDEVLFSMSTPFLMRELGVSKAQYAWLGGVIGAASTVVGSMLGGWLIKKWGLKRAIWPLTLIMNVNILAYVWLAWTKPAPGTLAGISWIAFIHGYEQIAAGIGSAVLLIYLLGTCKPEHKAAHYAIGSAIMSVGSSLVGGFGGELVERLGYLNLFLIAFVASLPSMLLLPFVPLEPVAARRAQSS